ncbi:EAL domain-containing protein [Nostoc flagelliforme FACHB-838]|uniref:EAL domain-containing protein n=1 Tax=Nostoc flagelliforme FACHB-838 TaxID=2692904 RepID=A0ABR8DYD2_9NOSO|nr:bifunctional diguanylate cyclase/phosphodiesterase [Nostoc flagelliforme]MBD2534487.1 EAL domain-containing protein [Nostoc flagelliforme FACHB-838]
MRTSEQIKAEIQEKFGFFPPFFEPAEQNTQVLENLWQQTLFAYVNNPLSLLFKEKLSAYLSRYCVIPYCMICHSCSLHSLGVEASKVLEMIGSPPPTETEIEIHLYLLRDSINESTLLSSLNPVVEESLLYCSIYMFLEPEQSQYCHSELRHLLGSINYQYLVTFAGYVKMCHVWIEAHPEVSYQTDKRAIEHLDKLVQLEPGLRNFFSTYINKVRREGEIQAEQVVQKAKHQRIQEALRQSNGELEKRANQGTTDLSDFSILLKQEIDKRQQAEAQLIHVAFHDLVTGLANRALFIQRLEQGIERVKKQPSVVLAVLYLDLDWFQVINNSLGYRSGDQLLIAFARRLEICVKSKDTLTRLEADEFAILLEDIEGMSDAINFAQLLQQELEMPFYLDCQEVLMSASIGIALATRGYEQAEMLVGNAKIAMHHAKALGKANYKVFDTPMFIETSKLLQLESDLGRAVENQELRVHYQPIVSLSTNKVIGFEALIRWQHPRRGLVFPGEFISVAEKTGIIVPISSWVLREACYQLYVWQQKFLNDQLTISVNLCGKQFLQSNLNQEIREILKQTNLDARSLKLEITETAIIENSQSTIERLWQLQEMGVQLHIDDFGTGYSSLSYLHHFPISVLKIDRSFINQIDTSSKNAEIVSAIVTLAHNLGIEVTAEGIETLEQLEQLQKLQCKYGQGYFFSKPVQADDVKGNLTYYTNVS